MDFQTVPCRHLTELFFRFDVYRDNQKLSVCVRACVCVCIGNIIISNHRLYFDFWSGHILDLSMGIIMCAFM